jgi:hypothetical protein
VIAGDAVVFSRRVDRLLNPFKRKRPDKYAELGLAVAEPLLVQKLLIPNFTLNAGAMGYIFGFFETALRYAKLEVRPECWTILTGIADALQPGVGKTFNTLHTNVKDDPEFRRGEDHRQDRI